MGTITRSVALEMSEGTFQGLSKSNLLFHQCIIELIDNAIGAAIKDEPFYVNVIFNKINDGTVEVYVADRGKGMDFDVLSRALQLGESATTESRLNEHGFGLKNALATLTSGSGDFQIWTKSAEDGTVHRVTGPFKQEMEVISGVEFPESKFLPSNISTLIKLNVKLSFIQTVQGRGARSQNLSKLRLWLIEHLGVTYRGYLEWNHQTRNVDGNIDVSIKDDIKPVLPIKVPIANSTTVYLNDIELGGTTYNLRYEYGTLDKVRAETLLDGSSKVKYYYQGNQQSQGIDIRLGSRVIATRQLENVWYSYDEDNGAKVPLVRHNSYNDFVGELVIPELPRGVLTTINNKTDFNLNDEDWQKIFDELNKHKPQKRVKEYTEASLRKKWIEMIRATNPSDDVVDDMVVWGTGTKIDVYRKVHPSNEVIIYELKAGSGEPIHLYQLKMYWDGLVLNNINPSQGILLVQSYNEALADMCETINEKMTPPPLGGDSNNTSELKYNFKIERHVEKGLREEEQS
ncbi:ATP-binding protein [Lentibacillus persicus]|nr:ATP-binding protein [Lentibacillus persicus]